MVSFEGVVHGGTIDLKDDEVYCKVDALIPDNYEVRRTIKIVAPKKPRTEMVPWYQALGRKIVEPGLDTAPIQKVDHEIYHRPWVWTVPPSSSTLGSGFPCRNDDGLFEVLVEDE